jgi:hypothetical protein
VSKGRAIAIVVGDVVITAPLQWTLGMAGLTDAFADADALYVLDTTSWLVGVAVSAVVGFGLALGLAFLLTRRLASPVRRVVLARFGCSLVLIVALAALSDLGNTGYDAQGHLTARGITYVTLFVWIAGIVLAVRWLRRATLDPEASSATV